MLQELGIIKAVLDIVKSLRDLLTGHTPKKIPSPDSSSPLLVAKRFVELFDAHGVKRSQIPRFFGHGLTLDILKTDESLLTHLSGEMLDAAAELFAVRRAWFDGESKQIYPLHDFYKKPDEFAEFANAITQRCTEFDIYCWVLRMPQPSKDEFDALIVIQEGIGFVDDRPIYRHHLCHNWGFKYWHARAYLAACIAIAWKHRWLVLGRDVDRAWLSSLLEGETMIRYDYADSGFSFPTKGHWETDDQVIRPEAFIQYLDEGLAGRQLGLDKWLSLATEGYMDLGSHPVKGDVDSFKAALSQVQSQS